MYMYMYMHILYAQCVLLFAQSKVIVYKHGQILKVLSLD